MKCTPAELARAKKYRLKLKLDAGRTEKAAATRRIWEDANEERLKAIWRKASAKQRSKKRARLQTPNL